MCLSAKDDPKRFEAGGGMGTRLADALLPESGSGTRRLYLRITRYFNPVKNIINVGYHDTNCFFQPIVSFYKYLT